MSNAFSRRRALQILGTSFVVSAAPWARGQITGPPRRPPLPIFPPRQPVLVTISSVIVNAEIQSGIARVEVSQIFRNVGTVPGEGDFVFPIPEGATVREFALYDGEKKLEAHLLNKDEATRAYEEIVRQRRDPALLSYVGRSLLRARVFPVPPGGERRVTLKLASVLPREGASHKFVWALAGPHLPGGQQPEHVSVRVIAKGAGNLYSPTHNFQIKRLDETRTLAEWSSSKNELALTEHPELTLYVAPKDTRAVALSALAYNAALPQVASLGGGIRQSGYFLVVASPNLPPVAPKDLPPRRVVLIMDRSGSMQGVKMEQARKALRFAIGKLRPQDHFNIVTFADAVSSFAPEPLLATPDNLKRAQVFVDDIVADSGTNIDGALTEGLKQFVEASSGNRLLFFTDGLPTVGVRDHDTIVQNAVTHAGKKVRCFVFGVGYDVDVPFLDRVASKLGGDADYVRPDEDIEVKTSQFVAKTSTPVLENLKLTVSGAKVGELYPKLGELPDLFEGGQLVLVGRFTGESEKVQLALSGEVLGKPQRFTLETKFPAVATEADFLPRLWASRKIGYLLDEVREEKDPARRKEIEDQIVALSKEFGILTPYTSLFVPEPGTDALSLGTVPFDRFRGTSGGFGGGGSLGGRGAAPPAGAALKARSGADAVNLSQSSRANRAQGQAGNTYSIQVQDIAGKKLAEKQAQQIQYANNRAFYQRGSQWEDSKYDPKKQTELVKIKLYSDAYFALVRRSGAWAKWASVGENVIVTANAKQAILFGNEGKEKLTDAELTQLVGTSP